MTVNRKERQKERLKERRMGGRKETGSRGRKEF